MGFEFDADTALTRVDDGRYEIALTDRWSIGAAPNGGYLMAVAARAVLDASAHPDPLTVTGHYLRPPAVGPTVVEVERVRAGRMISTFTARLRQRDGEAAWFAVATTDIAAADGPTKVDAAPPDLPPPDECVPRRPVPMPGGLPIAIGDRFDLRFAPGEPGWAYGRPSGVPEVRGWLRLADGREPDPLLCLVAVDSLPPTVFELGLSGWVPTIEMTVHVRARPAPGWLRVAIRSRALQSGFVEEDAEVWDADGTLVAMSRQLARVRAV
jgi:acyl-CoA thioesterase